MKGSGSSRRVSRSAGSSDAAAGGTGGVRPPARSGWGLLWLVDDDSHQRAMFLDSYRSARRWMPGAATHVWHLGEPLPIEGSQARLDTAATKWAAKFDAWSRSPFETTVFLDNDTFVLRDLEPLVRCNETVTALPYPNRLSRERVPASARAGLPAEWQNVNSGVVILHESFMAHYRPYWQALGAYANRVPGKDQYVFSLALHMLDEPWRRCWDLQVPTTPFAVEWLRRLWGFEHEPALGRVPLALIQQAYTFHATADKSEYHARFKEWFQLERAHGSTDGGMLDRRAADLPKEDLVANRHYAPHDHAPMNGPPLG